MKVIMVNGSRREHGCTYTALTEVAKALKASGIDSEIHFIGGRVLNGQLDEAVKEVATAMKDADGFVVGAPVYYASPSGEVEIFLDRLFGVARQDLQHKPAAALTSARRAGTTATLDALNKYFMISQMPVVSSSYWNMVHGNTPDDVMKDEEGLQIMRTLGNNMAWLMKSISVAKENGVTLPEAEPAVKTNFIR